MTQEIVQLASVTKSFNGRVAIDDVSFAVPEGAVYGLVGANGAGKTTMLLLALGLLWPDSGEVRLFGKPLGREAADFRQRVHYVGPEGDFFKSFTVGDMLQYTKRLYTRFDQTRCDKLTDVLELPLNRRIRNLSTGMKMQLRLTIALSARPDLLLLDEPTVGLDPVVKRQFLQLILQEASGQGTTVVLATHQLADVERMVDHVAFMYRGRTVASGELESLRTSIQQIQVVLPGELPKWIQESPSVLRQEHSGRLHTLVVEGDPSAIATDLRAQGATYLETLNVDLEELFQYVMEKEGYVRSGILLS